jgi:hypothetical protein
MPRPNSPYVALRYSETLGASDTWEELREKLDGEYSDFSNHDDALRQA